MDPNNQSQQHSQFINFKNLNAFQSDLISLSSTISKESLTIGNNPRESLEILIKYPEKEPKNLKESLEMTKNQI